MNGSSYDQSIDLETHKIQKKYQIKLHPKIFTTKLSKKNNYLTSNTRN